MLLKCLALAQLHLFQRGLEMFPVHEQNKTKKLKKLQSRYQIVEEVRGIGLMIGMGLTIPGGDIVKKGHERGLLLNVTHDTVLRFVPPLIVTKAEIDEMISILDGILKEI